MIWDTSQVLEEEEEVGKGEEDIITHSDSNKKCLGKVSNFSFRISSSASSSSPVADEEESFKK